MYSRKSNRNPIPPHLPEHYRGWAFRPDRPSPPPKDDRCPPEKPPRDPFPPPKPPEGEPLRGESLPPPLPPAIRNIFGGKDLLRSTGLNFEELLLIGLILLLGGNDGDSELPLLLPLLLLCG